MSNSVMEAMAAGCAVVTTAVDGNLELIQDGESGWLVPPDDPVALRETISASIDDSEERSRRGKAARATIEEHFSLEKMVNDWEAALEGALD